MEDYVMDSCALHFTSMKKAYIPNLEWTSYALDKPIKFEN
jgi:hypothetical protein